MAELTKTKILNIETGSATKNVDNLTKSFVPLRQQIKDLTLQLQQLEQGTEEYNRVATKLADTRQKQVEITEAAKYANRDFGQTMSNLTNISLGLVGGINAVNASINLLGGDAEKMQKALAPIQMAMAVIQGFAALDTAIKSLKGLSNAFTYTGESAQKAADEIGTMESELEGIGDKTISLDVDTTKAEESVSGLETDIDSIGDKSVSIDADTTKAEESVTELTAGIDSIGDKTVSVDADTTKAEESVSGLKTDIDSIGGKSVSIDADTTKAETSVKKLDKDITKTAKNKKIKIEADTRKADTAVKKLQTEIGSVEGTTVKVDADTTEAETKVGTLITEVDSIPSKEITIDADTTPVTESLEQVTETIEDMSDVDIEFKAEGIGEVTDEVKSLGEAEKTLTTNTSNATKATQNLDTATKAAAGSTATMAKGTKQAAVGTATLAAGEGVATKATWTLTGAIKAVGTAIKSIPVIGWIAMGVTLLTSLIRLISNANKESKEGEEIARKIAMAEQDRLDTLYEIERKYAKISEEMQKSINRLQLLPKGSREYNEELEKVAKQWVVSKEYAEAHLDKLKENAKTLEDYKTTTDQIAANYKYYDEQMAKKEKLERSVTTAVKAQADITKAILEELKDGTKDGIKITKDQADELEDIQKDLKKGRIDAIQAEEKAKKVVQATTDAYWEQANAAKQANINKMNGLEKQNANQKLVITGIQNESDAYDEMLKKQKEGREAAKEARRKYEEAQKSYIQALEDMKIADAEYNGDWNRYADERKKKAERVYNDDLKSYKKQLKEKLISKEQYDEILKASEEQYNNEVAQIQLDSNRKMWDQRLKDSLAAIEKEKQARMDANQKQYVSDTKSGVSTAGDTRDIANEEAELEAVRKTNEVLKERLQIVQRNKDESAEYAEYVKDLQEQIAANEEKMQQMELQIDLDSYNKRKKIVDDYYDRLYEKVEQAALDIEARNNVWGLGSPAVNTALEQQQLLIETLEQERETLENDHELKLISEEEYLIRKAELEKRYSDESVKLTRLELETKVNYFNAAFAAMQQLSNAVGAILDEEMSHYDENTQEYRQLAISRAVLDTIMGSFSAFISGVQSGIPAPANFILGGVLAALTTALGIASIAKLKSGNTSGTGSGTVSSAVSAMQQTTYETTAYEQQAELMGNVADQRVYVVENDISTTQNRVAVRESNATY